MDVERIAGAWIALQRMESGSEEYDKFFWAQTSLYQLIAHSPAVALAAIVSIMRRDSSNLIVQNLAAGPLESLLAANGPAVIDGVEELAHSDKDFRYLLGGVWKNAMTDEVWQRVQEARDVVW